LVAEEAALNAAESARCSENKHDESKAKQKKEEMRKKHNRGSNITAQSQRGHAYLDCTPLYVLYVHCLPPFHDDDDHAMRMAYA
jgi:hypothetical protein